MSSLQGAAGTFQLLQEKVFAHLQTAPTPDLSAESTTALIQLMLGQAQETFCIKASRGEEIVRSTRNLVISYCHYIMVKSVCGGYTHWSHPQIRSRTQWWPRLPCKPQTSMLMPTVTCKWGLLKACGTRYVFTVVFAWGRCLGCVFCQHPIGRNLPFPSLIHAFCIYCIVYFVFLQST